MDLVVQVPRFPQPGETVLGSDFSQHNGGKGANQAVATARMGGKVRMIGRVGADDFGNRLRTGLMQEGINVNAVLQAQVPTGVALISVGPVGQNTIIVSPGANSRLRGDQLRESEFEEAKVVLLQMESPLETVIKSAQLGKEKGATVVLNAAPALPSTYKILPYIDILVVNESEAELLTQQTLTNTEEALAVAELLREKCPAVIITLGERGSVFSTPTESRYVEAFKIEALDSTAAGDAFIGAFAVGLQEGMEMAQAVRFGNAAGALAVTKHGAQASLPTRLEVDELCAQINSARTEQ